MDQAQALINDCRKSGALPLDICSEDSKLAAESVEDIDPAPPEMTGAIFDYVRTAQNAYAPFSFADALDVYVQMAVEKSGLSEPVLLEPAPSSLSFSPTSAVGAILNVRARFMRRFMEKEAEGQQCVLLYCGDFDPGSL